MLKNIHRNKFKQMKITILSTSPRKTANTLRFSKAIKLQLEKLGYSADLIDFSESDIPLANQGTIDWANPSIFQKSIIDSMSHSTLVFVFTPEYNWLPSAEAINFINIFADNPRLHLFDNKVFALAGVSAGRGGRLPATILNTSLNKIIGFFGLNSFVSGKIFEAQEVPKVISIEGELQENELFNKGVRDFIEYNLKLAEKWS